jgi:hypothetical protein
MRAAMNGRHTRKRNLRVGLFLAIVALLYLAAVVFFIMAT